MRRFLPCCLLLIFAAQVAAEDGGFLPAVIAGIERIGAVRTFNPVNIFDCMDGAAEEFVAYHLKSMMMARYRDKNGREVTVEIYDQGDPREAYGVLPDEVSHSKPKIGQASTLAEDELRFRKDKFIVRVFGVCDPPLLQTVAREISSKLPDGYARPELLSLLPEEGLIKIIAQILPRRNLFEPLPLCLR